MEQSLSDLLKETIELTARKKRLAEAFLQLTVAQAESLEYGQVQELLSLIEQRQKCIADIFLVKDELLQVETKILQLCGISSWPSGKALFNSDWQIIESLRQDIRLLLKEAQSLDRSNRQTVSKMCGELKKTITSVRSRRDTLKAYNITAMQPGGYFIDHKS